MQETQPPLPGQDFPGVHILFSSVIPLDTRPESTDIWKTALAFGAQCYTELNNRITHVVAAKVILSLLFPLIDISSRQTLSFFPFAQARNSESRRRS